MKHTIHRTASLFFLLVILSANTIMAQDVAADSTAFKDAVHLREIPRHNLSLAIGTAQPLESTGEIVRAGLQVGLDYDYYFNKNIGLSASVTLINNQSAFNQQPDEPRPRSTYTTSITAGPVYSWTVNRFQLDVYARGGIAFLGVDDDTNAFLNEDREEFFSYNDATDSAAGYINAGLRFNYYFRRSVQVFFSPQFNSTLGKPIVYNTAQPINPINPVIVTPQTRDYNITNLSFSIGVKIALSPEYSNGELRDDEE